jgi:arginine:agmatine antiporter
VTEPRRTLGLFLTTLLVVGTMIGSGIFLLPASLAAIGSISILGWALAAIGAFLLAGVFAGLAELRPAAGGLFAYVGEALGPGPGFVIGVLYWFPFTLAPIALAAGGYLAFFFPVLAHGWPQILATLAILWLLTLANFAGARFIAGLGGWTLLIGAAPVLLIATLGWLAFDPRLFAAGWNPSGAAPAAAVWRSALLAFWAFVGVENAAIVAPLVRDPRRTVALASFIGVAIAAILYIAASAALMGMLPAPVLARSSAPFADAAAPLLGPLAGAVIALAAMIKAAGSLAAGVLVTVETAESPAVLGQLRPARAARDAARAPKRNLIVTGAIASLAIIASASPTIAAQFTKVVEMSVILLMAAYLAACLALLRLAGEAPRPRRMAMRGVAALASLFCLGILAAAEADLIAWALGFAVLAVIAWLVARAISPTRAGVSPMKPIVIPREPRP